MTQPTLVYILNDNITSGALYHRVATSGKSVCAVCARLTFRHEPLLFWIRSLCASRQAKITDLEVTVCIEQEVRRLEVTVDDLMSEEATERYSLSAE